MLTGNGNDWTHRYPLIIECVTGRSDVVTYLQLRQAPGSPTSWFVADPARSRTTGRTTPERDRAFHFHLNGTPEDVSGDCAKMTVGCASPEVSATCTPFA